MKLMTFAVAVAMATAAHAYDESMLSGALIMKPVHASTCSIAMPGYYDGKRMVSFGGDGWALHAHACTKAEIENFTRNCCTSCARS